MAANAAHSTLQQGGELEGEFASEVRRVDFMAQEYLEILEKLTKGCPLVSVPLMTCEAFPDPKSVCFPDDLRRDGAPSENSPPSAGSVFEERDPLGEQVSLAEHVALDHESGAALIATANMFGRGDHADLEDEPSSDESHFVEDAVTDSAVTDSAVVDDAVSEDVMMEDVVTVGEPLSAEARRAERMARCEQRIGYEFRDKQLLQGALTHASGAQHRLASNERLEFLGDAVLGLFVCELLFHRYPQFQEGDLTRVKSVVVSRQTCAKLSALLGLDEFLIMGKGMASNRSVPQSLMADVFESLVAALYLDGGSDVVREFLGRYITPEISLVTSGAQGDNYKSLLQQFSQRKLGATPTYQLIDEKGPDHSKCFLIRARVGGREFPPAWGRNKKEAEQRAACNAMAFLNDEPLPFPAE